MTHSGESVQDSAESIHIQPAKKRKKQVKQACAGCKKAHTRCEESRPCPRCRTLGIECVDAPRKKRKRRDDQTPDDESSAVDGCSDLNSSSFESGSFNQRVHRTEGVDGGEEVKVGRKRTAKRKSSNIGRKSKQSNIDKNLKFENLQRSLDQEQEGGDGSYTSSPSSSNEEFGDPGYIHTGDELNGGIYNYHQHHHLLYQDQLVQSMYSANNIQNNNTFDWEYYYERHHSYGPNKRSSDTTLAGLYYGIVSPKVNTLGCYNSNYITESANNSCAMLTDNYQLGNSVFGSGENSKGFYYQPDDLQRIRENYLKDWLC